MSSTSLKFWGQGQEGQAAIEPEKGDKRFSATDWQQNPVFDAAYGGFGAAPLHELRKPQTTLFHRGLERVGRLARGQCIQEPFNSRVERHGRASGQR